ncbi:hypothetical protein K502DRAFT_339734 [Neoconidiobolus thromboides FSU 785]|nr:hypothetical protein K502DRAFT_339734 [Neoconidiobolus thromboides FSU 785]
MANLQEIKRIPRYATAGYCSNHRLKNWDCNHCKTLDLDIQVKHKFYELYTGSKGFLTIDKAGKQTIVSLRNSIEIKNFANNANMLLSSYSVGNGNTDIHTHTVLKNPLYKVLKKFINEFGALSKEHVNYETTIIGYLFELSISTLVLIEFRSVFNLSWDRMELYTYDGFRVGNVGFAQWFNTQLLTIARVPMVKTLYHISPRFT